MPRRSQFFNLPDGTRGIVCFSSKSDPCSVCRKRSTLLCDFPVGGERTCDASLCRKCAVSPRKGIDYCPHHIIRNAA